MSRRLRWPPLDPFRLPALMVEQGPFGSCIRAEDFTTPTTFAFLDGPAPVAPRSPSEPPLPLAYFHGTVEGHGEGFWIIRVRPDEGPDGTAAVDPLACCTTFDAALAAGRLLSGVAGES